jgi:hypothetical protein
MVTAEIYPPKYMDLVSLLDMLRDYANFYYEIGKSFSQVLNLNSVDGMVLGDELLVRTKLLLEELKQESKNIQLEATTRCINRMLSSMTSNMLMNDLRNKLRMLIEIFEDEIEVLLFLHIPSYKVSRYQRKNLFGVNVFNAFPSAAFDIQQAGTAYAVGLYTACVFHLTSATEYFLRALARDRKIILPRNSTLDRATWDVVLKELDKELANIGNWPNSKGEVKTQAQEFYGTAIAEIRAIKDAWRNPVSHSKGNYMELDALQVMSHVERLGQTLSIRISESKRTPVIWTKAQLLVS